MSRHSTPASSRAICTASAPMSKADLSPKRPNGWRPTPMMATSSIARSSALVAAGGDRRELEGHDLVTVGVDVEGHHLQLHVHAEAELVGVALAQPGLDPDDVVALDEAHAEGLEALAGLVARVGHDGREALCGPGPEGALPRQQEPGHTRVSASRAAPPHRDGQGRTSTKQP